MCLQVTILYTIKDLHSFPYYSITHKARSATSPLSAPTTAQDSPSIAPLNGISYAQPTHEPMHSVATHAAEGDSTDEELMDGQIDDVIRMMARMMYASRRATIGNQDLRCRDDAPPSYDEF